MSQELVYQLEKLNDNISKLEQTNQTQMVKFSEEEFSEFRLGGMKDLIPLTVGAVGAPVIQAALGRIVPFGRLIPVVAGFLIRAMSKNSTIQNIGTGMIVTAVATIVANLIAGRGFSEYDEGMFNEDEIAFSEDGFSEDRIGDVTYG